MDDLDWMIVFGVAVPFVIGWVFVLPLSKRHESQREDGRNDGRNRHSWRIVLATGLASFIAFAGLFNWPTGDLTRAAWWGSLGQDQLIAYAMLAGVATGLVMSFTPRLLWIRAALIVALAGLVTLACWPIVRTESMFYRAMPAVGTIVFAGLFELAAIRRPGVCLPAALSLSLGTTSMLVFATGFQPLGFSAMAAAVVLGVCAIIALWRRTLTIGDGAVLVVVPLLVLAPLIAWLYLLFGGDDFPALAFLLPMFAPCMVFLGELPKLKNRKPIVRNGIVLSLVALMCAGGVGLAFWPSGEGSGEQQYDEMGFPTDP